VESVVAALAALPVIQSDDASTLGAARYALARAVASGQSAEQLSQDLAAPGRWLGADLKAVAAAAAAAAPPGVAEAATAAPPGWARGVAQAAVQAASALRVAVVDRDPSAVNSLSLPAWAIGQKPAASHGPVSVEIPDAQLTVSKWLISYLVPVQMVSFVRGASTVFVAPVAGTGTAKNLTVAAGSVWINVASFASGAPAGSFAGIAGQAGTVTCDQDLALGGSTVTIPAGATLTLTVTPAGSASSGPSMVAPPGTMTFSYPDPGAAAATIGGFSASVYGSAFSCAQTAQPAVYGDITKTLLFPCSCTAAQFTPGAQTGVQLSLTGSAPLTVTGWALPVASSAPAALGNAAGPGLFLFGFGTGLYAQWPGLSRPEPESGGTGLASSAGLLLALTAGLAPGVTSQLKVGLWDAPGAPNTITAIRLAGSGLVYEFSGTGELLELGATLDADLDRPLLADGERAPVSIPDGIVLFTWVAGKQDIFAYAAYTAAQIPAILDAHPAGFPLALDNAFLEVSTPLLFVLAGTSAQTQASGEVATVSGAVLVGFIYRLQFPFLPDPYTGPSISLEDSDARGGLLAEITWTTPADVTTRVVDLEHPHPAQPPATEASSGLASPARRPVYLPEEFRLGLADADLSPAVAPALPFGVPAPATAEALAAAPAPAPAPAAAAVTAPTAVTKTPPGVPVPPAPAGLPMLDVSTRASLFGVEIVGYDLRTAQNLLSIDGLSARTYTVLAPVITLPAISWEPMYDQAAPEPGSPTDQLLNPPGDGPLCGVGADSVTLVPVSPIQSLAGLLAGTRADKAVYGAVLTLPFGAVAGIDQVVGPGAGPAPRLTQPTFDVQDATGSPVTLTGAYQLTLLPPGADPNAPVFAGKTYLRTQDDNPAGTLSYGEQVLGLDVAYIFSTEFNHPGSGVPVKRYDLTGYGASLFTDWTNLNPPDPTAIIQVDFTTTVGRTSHEIIKAQSVIYPWGIRVVRTITIDRLNSGSVERTDSGWIAASDGDFTYIATASGQDIQLSDSRRGLVDSLVNVRNVREFGLPLPAQGTSDATPVTTTAIALQPVTFDADVAVNPLHQVLKGGSHVTSLPGVSLTGVPSTGIIGYIGLEAGYHLSLTDLLTFLQTLPQSPGGPMNATLNLGRSNSILRTVAFAADPVQDAVVRENALVVTVRGVPTLPAGSAWTVALKQAADAAPRALDPTQPVPVVSPDVDAQAAGAQTHFADPSDIFRLAASPPTPPASLYGFLQDVTTQKTFLARPFVTAGTQELSLGEVPSLADPGMLLGAAASFPVIGSALPLTGLQNLASSLGLQSLAVDKWFDTDPAKVTPLIQTGVAVVDLLYSWQPAGLTFGPPPDPADSTARIHVTLGQPTGPTWSIDIYEVALALKIPPVDPNDAALYIAGSFHADSQSPPNFPDLQVVYAGPLKPLTQFFRTLQSLGNYLGGGGATPQIAGAQDDTGDSGPGLDVHFADGRLTVQDTFALPAIPLGPGTIENISLDLGADIDIVNLDVGFLVGIGSPDAPVHWIVDPMSGTGCLQAGVQDGALAVLIQLGLGLGLAIDLAVASGSASITIAFQVQVNGNEYELMLLLTGQAQVSVLGGVASAAITMSCGLGLEFEVPPPQGPEQVTAIGTASVGINISICWVVSIDWSGSWSFSHQFELPAL
jgi:hypothetical protein